MQALKRFLPFLRWWPLSGSDIKLDFMAGITVALVLIPQSMAYAQLAGMPPYYGLYAAFLPVIIAALFGSSNQLGTGPVAVVSLLTASSLAVLAAPGSPDFIALAIMLALMVGIVQLTLGVFKLGVIVNFLSHPVIVGFTNAAAIIIGLSQVSKIFGVTMGRSEVFINDIIGVFKQIGDTHLPTLAMGVFALVLMWALRKFAPRLPGVLIAVVVTTLLSWALQFERNADARLAQIADPVLATMVENGQRAAQRVDDLTTQVAARSATLKKAQKEHGNAHATTIQLEASVALARIEVVKAEAELKAAKAELKGVKVVRMTDAQNHTAAVYRVGHAPAGAFLDETEYAVAKIKADGFKLVGGGEVVGSIPEGLPSMTLPTFSLEMFSTLLSAALVISLVGFMEAISIAKAVAAKTKQRLDPNQELIGQGLANIVGSLSQSFPTSGSFSRTAVNVNAGAQTGMSSVFTGVFVLLTLLFLTPLLYHLPQAVLAAIIIMAVIGLVNVEAIKHAWHASRHDGIAAIVAFVATLAFAPHLDSGIMVGAGLAIGMYLYRSMKPRVAILGRYPDGTLRDIKFNPELPTSPHLLAVRYDGSLYFANVSFFEDAVLEAVAQRPFIKSVLIVGNGINQLDASGEEIIHHLVERMRSSDVSLVFSGLKKQVLDVMRATGLYETIGEENFFATENMAITAIYDRLGHNAEDDQFCALKPAMA